MALKLEDKQAIVAEVAEVAKTAVSALIADYRGLTVAEMTELRVKAREKGVYLRIVRNTLARRALKDTNFSCFDEALVGPLFLAFSQNEPSACARLLKDFTKENEKIEVKALAIGGKLIAASRLADVASLPTYIEAVAILMGVLIAPCTKLVRTIVEPYAKFVRALSAVGQQKSV